MAYVDLKGMGVALITPFKADESVDYEALINMVDFLIENGTDYIVALGTTAETARVSFVRLRELRDQFLREADLPLLELSMGMSNDFETAIEEGATLLRIGSALFEGVEP